MTLCEWEIFRNKMLDSVEWRKPPIHPRWRKVWVKIKDDDLIDYLFMDGRDEESDKVIGWVSGNYFEVSLGLTTWFELSEELREKSIDEVLEYFGMG